MNDELQSPQPMPDKETRQISMFCHLGALLGFFIPFANLLVPLAIWQIKRELDPFIDAHGKESMNFQINVTLAMLVSTFLITLGIGLLLVPLVGLGWLILTVIGGLKANEGKLYRYPFIWRPLK